MCNSDFNALSATAINFEDESVLHALIALSVRTQIHSRWPNFVAESEIRLSVAVAGVERAFDKCDENIATTILCGSMFPRN